MMLKLAATLDVEVDVAIRDDNVAEIHYHFGCEGGCCRERREPSYTYESTC